MPITYRQHQDTRDGKIYNCVLMPDGMWWSAENLAWDGADASSPGGNAANVPLYGLLYPRDSIAGAVPAGTHGPSRSELRLLLNSLGLGTVVDGGGIPSAISSALLSTSSGGVDSFGFTALKAGRIYLGNPEQFGYASWIGAVSSDAQYYFAQLYIGGGAFTQANTDQKFSVRFIVDVFNEPIPPTKIKGMFSGSGVKAYFTNHNTPTLELPISAQTTTELTIDKDFISFWGPFLGNVRILVVDGEYISEWKDWNFNV